jgi:hypothetical protein
MKLSLLLSQRRALLRQARLANLAFAYDRLVEFARRIHRARLRGTVCLRQTGPDADQFWASLTMLDGSQAVLEEHFADEDIMDFAEVISHVTSESELDVTFPIERLEERFLEPLLHRLTKAGITIDHDGAPPAVSSQFDSFENQYRDDEL